MQMQKMTKADALAVGATPFEQEMLERTREAVLETFAIRIFAMDSP
jgi:hypothetical protein